MNLFTPGRRFKARGQSYEILGAKEHWTRDERLIEMIRYRSVCAHPGCKRVFDAVTTKSMVRRGRLNKRCQLHHAPGVPAPVKKAKKTTAKKVAPKRRLRLVPRSPPMSPEALERVQLVREAVLAVKRGQRPSYLD
ncbi:hypothetical protein AOQ73_36335 [Bradyrhizobium pachyrhizi]|uniref:hypothetical protein n=1 Tax=Bradyrhizobium pachyrhizi TaxID=280333 RepID=UPI0007053196|nr:hypothetical protein [Bradyrhizobium pachyrhizi]KRP85950.1 hypothetical protein AOQ73_36335 [Bradyrhizobium pachyrhizi]